MKTLESCFLAVASATVLVAPLFAQTAEFQATYRGVSLVCELSAPIHT